MKIPVFYTPKMSAHLASSSPSTSKPDRVVADWQKQAFPIDIIEPVPATRNQLKLAHSSVFVDDVLECRTNNGFGNREPQLAESLPYTTGAMISAARAAIKNRKVAVAPCAGFHHAGFASALDFCTFNGLMVTAMVLKAAGEIERVGILDFDMHYGNGTASLIRHHNCASWIEHYSAGREYYSRYQASEFIWRVPEQVEEMRDCDIILYQAGADQHVNDPLGGFLTTEQLQERDQIVFEMANRLGVPVAWNLAGGYQKNENGEISPVIEIHRNTMQECAKVYVFHENV